ncbi:MAG: MATE family efflux transporter [Oscillospiraceae bacterium]|nr:MATE family efflux transporter [Oscillospiraceae bacterium]
MTQQDEKKYLFENMPIPRAVLKLAIPVVISSLVTIIYNLADTFFVGMLNDPVQNAAVTLVYPVMLAFYAVNNLFGVGTSSMMSRSLGRGDYEKVRSASAFGFYGAVFSGLLFSLLCTLFQAPLLEVLGAEETTQEAASGYMLWTVCVGAMPSILNVVQSYMVRSEGAALHASIGTMSGCILNIILDPVFILPWGLNMGAAGAGLATFVSNCAACAYFLILARVKKGNTFVCMDIRRLRKLSKDVVLGIFGVGIPSSIQNLLNVLGFAVLNNFTAVFGASAVAAMGISHKINMVPMQVVLGFAQGVMPLIGYNYASGNHSRMKKGIDFALAIIVPIMLSVTLVYWFSAGQLIRLFIANEEIIAYGARFLRGMCLCMTFICVDFMVVGVFQSLGMGKLALLFACLRKTVLEIPLLFILNAVYPLYGLPYAQPGAEIVMAVLAFVMLRRIYRKKCKLQK